MLMRYHTWHCKKAGIRKPSLRKRPWVHMTLKSLSFGQHCLSLSSGLLLPLDVCSFLINFLTLAVVAHMKSNSLFGDI